MQKCHHHLFLVGDKARTGASAKGGGPCAWEAARAVTVRRAIAVGQSGYVRRRRAWAAVPSYPVSPSTALLRNIEAHLAAPGKRGWGRMGKKAHIRLRNEEACATIKGWFVLGIGLWTWRCLM